MLLVISLDSENDEWLRQRMASGDLPNLAALARSGITLAVNAATVAGVAYPTLYTGERPADLGVYFPVQWEASRQALLPWREFAMPESVFERIERFGKRIVVLDPPEARPAALHNGLAASGIQFRARVLLHSWTSDCERASRLTRAIGRAPRADEIFGAPSAPGCAADLRYLRRALLQAPARLQAAALEAIRREAPDCLWATCCGMHVAGHQFFHLPCIADTRLRAELEGTRLELAQGYDRMIGALAGRIPPGSQILIAYAKGMGRVTNWLGVLPEMLDRVLGQTSARPVNWLRRVLPRTVRRWAARGLSDERSIDALAQLSAPRVDWNRTRAFTLPSDSSGFIRLNVAGRERAGIVRSAEIAELKQAIRAGLASFTGDNGAPCVERIVEPVELLGEGRHIGRFPDLIVEWKQPPDGAAPGGGLRSPKFGVIAPQADTVGRSGNHCQGAFAILSDRRLAASIGPGPLDVMDIPSAILSALGVAAEGGPVTP